MWGLIQAIANVPKIFLQLIHDLTQLGVGDVAAGDQNADLCDFFAVRFLALPKHAGKPAERSQDAAGDEVDCCLVHSDLSYRSIVAHHVTTISAVPLKDPSVATFKNT